MVLLRQRGSWRAIVSWRSTVWSCQVQPLEDVFHAIEGHQVGDEVTFTLQRPGKADPFTAMVKMLAPPPDDGRLQIPEGFPPQILSLGFLPSVPGDFLLRFSTAAAWLESFAPAGPEDAVPYAFDTLQAVSRRDTAWSIVFDPANLRVHFRTHSNPQIRYLDLGALDFSCRTPVMMLDIHADLSGDIKDDLVPYSHQASLDHFRDDVYCEYYNANFSHTPAVHATMVRTDKYKLVAVHGLDTGELYDPEQDPNETYNRWDETDYQSVKSEMLKRLCDRMAWTVDPLPVRQGWW